MHQQLYIIIFRISSLNYCFLFSPSIHICVTMLHTQPGVAEQFINDVKKEVAIIMQNPKEKTTGMVGFTMLYTMYIMHVACGFM